MSCRTGHVNIAIRGNLVRFQCSHNSFSTSWADKHCTIGGGWIQYPCDKYVTSLPHQPCPQPKMWPSSHPVPPIQQPETIFQCLMPYYKAIASSRCQEERAHLSLETIVIISLWHQLWFISYTTVILLHYINMSFVLFLKSLWK